MKKEGDNKIGLIIGIIILLLVLIFGIYFVYMKYFNVSVQDPILCDSENFCDSKSEACVILPENGFPTCEYWEIGKLYECPNGTIKNIIETFPVQIVCEEIVGGDEDEYGCIGSAGYTWCESKQKCLRVWEEDC